MGTKRRKVSLEVATYWVNDHHDAPCSGNSRLKYCDDVAQGFGKAMKRRGHRWTDHDDRTGNPGHFVEGFDAKVDGGRGADAADFALLAAHGALRFHEPAFPKPKAYWFSTAFGVNSPDLGGCRWFNRRFPTSKGLWRARLGNGRLKWLLVDACESAQVARPRDKELKKREATPASQWDQAFDGLHLLLGFTDDVSDGSWTKDRGAELARRIAGGDPIGEAWSEEGYSWWKDDYPVALAAGRDRKDAKDRLDNERLDSGYRRIPAKDIKFWAWHWRD